MSKINGIGIPVRDVDQIITRAIRRIGTGEDRYSCCALTPAAAGDVGKGWKVRKAYTHTFGPVTDYPDSYGYAFAAEVQQATNEDTETDFRVLMLSLFRAAWRDLT